MKPGGWKIQPLGWLLVIVLVATVCYVLFKRRRPLPPPQEKKT